MNETTMTLEELVKYAQEAKEQTEKEVEEERQNQIAIKNTAYHNIIKNIIDKLKEKKGKAVSVEISAADAVSISGEEYTLPIIGINLEEIEAKIKLIPALKATIKDFSGGSILEVTFSETEPTELPIPEEVDEIEVTLLPIPEEILEVDGSEDK